MSKRVDVVIIGAGAGGGTSAWALARKGLNILVLESGPAYDPNKDYKLDQDDWEKQGFPDKGATIHNYRIAALQPLDDRYRHLRSWNQIHGRYNPGRQRKGWRYHHVRGLGGSTLHFSGESHRLHKDAFNIKSRFGVGADWPVDYQTLEPFYQQAETIVGVAGPTRQPGRPRSQPFPLPAHAASYASHKFIHACKKLGMQSQPNSMAILPRPYDGRPDCNYCAQCNRGCPRTDKGSVDVTFIARARSFKNCQFVTGAEVTHLEAGDNDRINKVIYKDTDGKFHAVSGDIVIISCGAVESPRLLLNSANKFSPDGLGNDSGHVGKHFMETLSWNSSALFDEPLGSHRGITSDTICWDYNAPDSIDGIIGGCRIMATTSEADLAGPIGYATRVVNGWGKQHKRAMRQAFGNVLGLGAIGESLPNDKTYIDLDPEYKDTHDKPVARIHSHLDQMAIRRLEFMAKTVRSLFDAAGQNTIFEEYGTYDFFSSTHVFGGCRMGGNEKDSVVNQFCRSHRWKNLYVIDASIFPSSGGGESPSLTIEALALRACNAMVSRS
ncbi:MAG: GMC family oxidoreductase [Gammaproteobacteria bacterium]|nr:MAG: GMC family oxidoreductase [Gammaproteobacteria bacterium]